jgi:Trm5-related predicted tRNA methylase
MVRLVHASSARIIHERGGVVSDRIKKMTSDLLRTATVLKIEQDALDAAAKAAKRKRVVMIVPQRSIGRIQNYLVRRCYS